MSAVIDAAERGVKLSSDFVTLSREEDTYQDNLQYIEEDRKNVPDLRTMSSARNKIL